MKPSQQCQRFIEQPLLYTKSSVGEMISEYTLFNELIYYINLFPMHIESVFLLCVCHVQKTVYEGRKEERRLSESGIFERPVWYRKLKCGGKFYGKR